MQTIKRLHLSGTVHQETDLSLALSRAFIDATLNIMADALKEDGSLKIHNFGTFKTLKKASRPGRNPKTGEMVTVSGRTSVSFAPSPSLKDAIKNKLSV